MKKNMFHEIEEDELLVLLCHVGNRLQESDVRIEVSRELSVTAKAQRHSLPNTETCA
ncbi:MAG: hypothetical protein ACLURV_08580 [Gallintestinimicrobium sp.]